MKIGVLASGGGTNLQAIIDAIKNDTIKESEISIVISNRKNAYALQRAKDNDIESVYLNKNDFENREAYDKKVVEVLKEAEVDLVILAGYLRWITKTFVDAFRWRIMNIHPSLLPSFKGLHGIEQAYEYGVKVTGVTVHYVDETEDGGPIILQEEVRIDENDTLDLLEKKIHKVEHRIYPKAIEIYRKGLIRLNGRKTKIES